MSLEAAPLKLTHITFKVRDLARTIDFYRRWCGYEPVHDRRAEGGSTVWLGRQPEPGERPSFVLVVMESGGVTRVDHLGFQVTSRGELDGIAERARAEGCHHMGPTEVGGSVGTFVMIRDPSGHIVEFTHGQPIVGV